MDGIAPCHWLEKKQIQDKMTRYNKEKLNSMWSKVLALLSTKYGNGADEGRNKGSINKKYASLFLSHTPTPRFTK